MNKETKEIACHGLSRLSRALGELMENTEYPKSVREAAKEEYGKIGHAWGEMEWAAQMNMINFLHALIDRRSGKTGDMTTINLYPFLANKLVDQINKTRDPKNIIKSGHMGHYFKYSHRGHDYTVHSNEERPKCDEDIEQLIYDMLMGD